jgi:putative peptidoglycan lipid II flippase
MSFARSLFTVSGLTVVSRVAGFIRDTLTAMLLGAGPIADAFFVAQRLPNLFRSLFAEGAFSAAFVPLYSAERQKLGLPEAQRFAGEAQSLLLFVLIPFSILMILFMPWVIRLLAPGFSDEPEKFQLAVDFSRITFPYLIFISVTALQGGVLNALGRFGPAAAAPTLMNVVLIVALLLVKLLDWPAGQTLSVAITVSGILQMLWLGWSCRRAGAVIPVVWPELRERTQRLFKQVGPGAIGAGATQINILLSTILASTLPTGAISYLFYADRLNQLPLGIVGIAVATTLLPLLSRHVEEGNEDTVRHYTSRAIEFSLMLGLPAAIGLGLAAQPIIQTLFERGAFSRTDTIETAKTLAVFALGIPAFLLVKVFSAGMFARHDTKTPVKVALIAMATNVVASVLLLGLLQHVGIALANSLAVWVNAGLLFIMLRNKDQKIGDAKLLYRLPRLIICALGMGLVTLLILHATQDWFAPHHLGMNLMALATIILPSVLAYALLLQLTGAMRWRQVAAMLKRKADTVRQPELPL